METLHKIWMVIKNILSILRQSRFSLIIVLLTVISLEYVGQVKDILVGLKYPESSLQVAFFIFAVNWLAFQSWGWARFIYNRTHVVVNDERGAPGYERWLIDWLPRIYALAAFIAAYRAARRADIDGIAITIIVVALVVLAILYFRRQIAKKLSKQLKVIPDNFALYFTYLVMAISTVYAIASPVGFGALLGAGAVVFLGLGSIIPVGTLLVSAARENGFPVVGALLLAAVIFSPFNDNHHVREIEGEKGNTQNVSLKESLQTWLSQADNSKPMVLVTTAGGGLRASYWTGVILGRLQDKIPDFNRQLFAVSGVSGGSVGAVFYNSALASAPACEGESGGENKQPCFETKLLKAIGQDYLAATAASMLYGDLIQRFLPFPVFSDRAAALEESWEVGFDKIYPQSQCGLDKSFTHFYQATACGQQWLPRLLINGTYEESGRRLLTTSFQVQPKVFLDTHDFYALNDQNAIRASTAALNSARFSYVSPAGTFGDDVGHVIDGGYFENYGANTLTNLIDWLKRHPDNPLKSGLVVIAVSNDSGIPFSQYAMAATPETAKSQKFLNEVLAPILGLSNTRSGHGMLAYKQLVQFTQQINDENLMTTQSTEPKPVAELVHFYLSADKGEEPPLGWILSRQSQENMQRQISEGNNCRWLNLIMKRFGVEEGEECRQEEN